MGDWEENLPERMKERLAKLGDVTAEERAQMRLSSQVDEVLSGFFNGELDSDELWKRIKQQKEAGHDFVLKGIQVRIIDSLNLGTVAEELKRRMQALMAIESLKETQNTAALDIAMKSIEGLETVYHDEMQQAYEQIKAEVEKNPQLRMRQVGQGESAMITQLSVDEAVRLIPQWRSFVANHEARYQEEFLRVTARLKQELK